MKQEVLMICIKLKCLYVYHYITNNAIYSIFIRDIDLFLK